MIELLIDQLLEQRGRTFYWLAKETGISHTTLWRLKKARAYGITLDTLGKICDALNCQPGDILKHVPDPKTRKKTSKRKA